MNPPVTELSSAQATIRQRLDRLGNGDPARVSQLIVPLLELFRARAAQGLAALATAVGAGDADLVQLEAHGLKGAAANIGADQLAQRCLDLELLGPQRDLTSAARVLAQVRQEATVVAQVLDELTPALRRGL